MIHRISAQEIPNVLNSAKPKKPSLVTSNFSDSSSNKNSRLADHRITSLRSEASSCNSHTALMPTLKRNGSQKRGINGRRMFLTAFPCFDKKDVCINHHQLPTRARSQSLVKQQREEEEIEIDLEESRNSIEVFGSGSGATLMKGEVAKNMERKLSMLTWDAIPRARNIPDGDDVASDASSDLFEIETISGAAHPVTVADDAASLCTSPASRYAPSEASIQWIVVTDETAAGDVRGCEAHECRRGRILGCRSLKAVELAQNVASKTVSSEMGAEKGKKQRSGEMEEERNGAEVIDGELVKSIEKLQSIQEDLEKINEEASEKVLELEQQYNEIRKPVYDKRNEVIKAIPDFWLTAFMSHPALTELLTEEDQKIFKYLDNLEVEDFKDVKSGYSISFIFKSNPHFEDTKLTKTFTFLEEGVTRITATNIKWKEGMGIPNGIPEEKKGNKRSHAEESFFSWFTESEFKGDMYEINDEVADIIKDDLWPNPLTYFNNEAEEDLEMDDDEDDEGSDGSKDDDDDDDDDKEDAEA